MKIYLKTIGASALLFTIIVPSISFAETSGSPTSEKTSSQFCATIANRVVKINKGIDAKQDTLEIRRHDKLNKKSAERASRDAQVAEHRQDADGERADKINTLESKASTDAQKAAIAQFKTTMTTALATRRSAVDAAITTFRKGVDSVTANRTTSVDTALANLKAARLAAVTKAQADCTSGVDSKTAKATFDASIKTAQTEFQTAKAGFVKKDDITNLSTARKTAIEKAINDFKVTRAAAVTTLKQAFGQ